MRVGITLTPAPSTQIASTHELLEDDELTRIHDMAIDFRWITAVGINIGNTGPLKDQPFQLRGALDRIFGGNERLDQPLQNWIECHGLDRKSKRLNSSH